MTKDESESPATGREGKEDSDSSENVSLDALLDRLERGPSDAPPDDLEALTDRRSTSSTPDSLDSLLDRIADSRDSATTSDAGEDGVDARESDEAEPPRGRIESAGTVDAIESASHVLVLDPFQQTADTGCRLLLESGRSQQQHLVLISLTGSIEKQVKHIVDDLASPLSRISVITSDAPSRWEREGEPSPWLDDLPVPVTIETISDPSDLTKLGITISNVVSALEGNTIKICFHSLTGLLQYTDLKRAFRFLNVLQGRIDSIAGTTQSHYQMNPEAHDNETVATIRSLFDAVIEVTEDGIEVDV